jgi:hypothetical protein
LSQEQKSKTTCPQIKQEQNGNQNQNQSQKNQKQEQNKKTKIKTEQERKEDYLRRGECHCVRVKSEKGLRFKF